MSKEIIKIILIRLLCYLLNLNAKQELILRLIASLMKKVPARLVHTNTFKFKSQTETFIITGHVKQVFES